MQFNYRRLFTCTILLFFSSTAYAGLIESAKAGNLAGVRAALLREDDIMQTDKNGNNALMWASWNGHGKIVQELLAAKADVHATDGPVGDTALTKAAFNGGTDAHVKIVRALLAAGANIETKNGYEVTALMNACSRGHIKIVKTLLQAKADATAVDQGGVTALHKAAWGGHNEIIEKLLDAGAHVDVKRHDGVTPIMLAESALKANTVKLLISHGAQIPERSQATQRNTAFEL